MQIFVYPPAHHPPRRARLALTISVLSGLCMPLRGSLASAESGSPRTHLHSAMQHVRTGDISRALDDIRSGLQLAPRHRELLQQHANLLYDIYDYDGALGAYRALLSARPRLSAGERTRVRQIIHDLRIAQQTEVQLNIVGGPATVYLNDSPAGPVCVASATCTRKLLPRHYYRFTVKRPGFAPYGQTIRLNPRQKVEHRITLQELPSTLTIEVQQPADAEVHIDGQFVGTGAQTVTDMSAGTHLVEVKEPGFQTYRAEHQLHLGQPVSAQVTLSALVPVVIAPAQVQAELEVDGATVTLDAQNRLLIPPGSQRLTVRADGYVTTDIALTCERDRVTSTGRGDSCESPGPLDITLRPVPPPPVVIPGWSPGKKIAVATTASLATASLATSVTYGIQARRWLQRALPQCPPGVDGVPSCSNLEDQKLIQRAQARATTASYFLVGGLAMTAGLLGSLHLQERATDDHRWSWHRKLSVAGTGSLVAIGAAVGVRMGLRARASLAAAQDACAAGPGCGAADAPLVSQARRDANNATLGFVLSGASAGVLALLLATVPDAPGRVRSKPSIGASIGTDGVHVSVGGQF